MKHSYIKVIVLSTLMSTCAWANTTAVDSNKINHCYHWIKEGAYGYLTKKYNDAPKFKGGFSFEFQGSGNAAGEGIYCAKTPKGSMSYGDRVVRLDLVEDVIIQNDVARVCHQGGVPKSYDECRNGKADLYIYTSVGGGDEWYVIKNPEAIESWSTNTDQIKKDLIDNSMASHPVHGLMDKERTAIGLKQYYNGNARQTLAKTLNDAEKLKKVSPFAMVASLANYQKSGKTDIPKDKVARHLKDFLGRLFQGSEVNASEIISLETQFPELGIKNMAKASLTKMDPVVALALNDKMSFVSSSDDLTGLWRSALTSPKAMADIDKNTFAANGPAADAFTKLIKRDAGVMASRISGKNAERTLLLLNTYITSGDSQVSGLAASLVKELLRDGSGVDIAALYKKIDNPQLKKDQIFGATILENALKEKDADPVSIAMALSVVKTDLTDAQKKVVIAKLEAMPLKSSAQPTYQIFENYKNGKVSPELLPEVSFMPKLVERALQEQVQGGGATNVYRLLLSEYYGYFNYHAQRGDADLAYAKAEKVFEKIFKSMIKAQRFDYAIAALQNYTVFHTKSNKWQFTMIKNLDDKNNFSSSDEFDSHVDTVVRALDGDLINTLISTAVDDANALSRVSKFIVSSTLNYLKSSEFQAERKKATFLISQKEKSKWQNFGLSGRYASDVCYMTRILEARKDVLISKFAGEASGLEHTLSSINDDFCQGQLN